MGLQIPPFPTRVLTTRMQPMFSPGQCGRGCPVQGAAISIASVYLQNTAQVGRSERGGRPKNSPRQVHIDLHGVTGASPSCLYAAGTNLRRELRKEGIKVDVEKS